MALSPQLLQELWQNWTDAILLNLCLGEIYIIINMNNFQQKKEVVARWRFWFYLIKLKCAIL